MGYVRDASSTAACAPSHLVRALFLLACTFICAFVLNALPGCGSSTQGGASTASAAPPAGSPGNASASAAASSATGAAYQQPTDITIPEATDEGIDVANANSGWVSASAESAARLKFQVACGEMVYNYDLPNDGTPTLFPVNMGNGTYLFRIMQNTSGNKYVELDRAEAEVELANENAPFLIPNQICSYTKSSACVAMARELTASATNEGQIVETICTYVANHVTYDTAKAEELSKSSGYIPDPDETLATGKGICFDYAALSAAMLRSLGMPTKVMTGYVGDEQLYHSWIMVFADGTWKTAVFSISPKTWSRCDVTFASTGATAYAGSGINYTDRYTY